MKLKFLTLIVLNLTLTLGAQAAMKLPITVCSKEKAPGPQGRQYIQKLTVTEKLVTARYYSLTGDNLGSDYADFVTPVVASDAIIVTDATFKDGSGGDGWMDHMNVKITKKTVAFYKKGEKMAAKPIIPCPQHQTARF